jgi:hypothetical protein
VADLQAPEEASSLQQEHLALQNKRFFFTFYFLWVIFAFLDPDPQTQINPYPSKLKHLTYVECNPMLDCTYVTGEEKTAVGSSH